MYIVAFGTAFLLYRRQVRERNFPMGEEDLSGLFTWGIVSLLLGARIFSTLVYEIDDLYRTRPWLIFWPFQSGKFTGFKGMSYHGGVIGGVLSIIVYSKIKKFDLREIGDMYAASIPLGYTFGRIGNFINGELWGRVTTGPLGMIFPQATLLSTRENWVREAAEQAGIDITPGALVNLPRYPSQLFEAFFEGVLLWLIIWLLRNRKPFKGFLISIYLAGYGIFRFFIEYFREPDAELGYRIQFVPTALSFAQAHPPLSFSTGQILSFAMIVLGVIWFFAARRLPDSEPVRVYPSPDQAPNRHTGREREENRKNRRKMRKKLR
jgi:phosphatidylglycerol:prolipoprotein diacylglycerol transferase